jgi:DNA repair exonuclease SbcCD ATPase subunit
VRLDEAVHNLYGLPAAEFVAARTSAASAASGDSDRALAKQIKALKKPSAAAAAVNALARAHGDRIAELTRLHDEFSNAQDDGDRNALQDLGARRRALITELTQSARELVEETGSSLSAAALDEVAATFLAAVADDTAAKAAISGCLVRALTANGFDPADIDDAVAVPISGLRSVPRAGSKRRTSADSRGEKEARAALKEAMRAATRANAEIERADASHDRAERRRQRLQAERDELNERLADVNDAIAALDRELKDLAANQKAAANAARKAEDAVAAARRRTSTDSGGR